MKFKKGDDVIAVKDWHLITTHQKLFEKGRNYKIKTATEENIYVVYEVRQDGTEATVQFSEDVAETIFVHVNTDSYNRAMDIV